MEKTENIHKYSLCKIVENTQHVIITFTLTNINKEERFTYKILNGPVVLLHKKTCVHVLKKKNRSEYQLHKLVIDGEKGATKIVYCDYLLEIDHYLQYLVLVHTSDLSSRKFNFKYLPLHARSVSDKLELANMVTERPDELSQDPLVFHIPNSYASVCTNIAYQLITMENVHIYVSTMENQVVQFAFGNPLRVIKTSSIPKHISVIDFGLVSVHSDTFVIIECDQNVILYSLLENNVFKEIKNVKQTLVGDFMRNGMKQILFIHDDKQPHNNFSMMSDPNVPMIGKSSQTTSRENVSSKGQHLYSVLRALQTRLEDGDTSIYQLQQIVSFIFLLITIQCNDKSLLLEDMKRLLNEITGNNNLNIRENELNRDHLVSSNGITINFNKTRTENGSPVSRVAAPDILSAKQSFNNNEWTVDMTVSADSKVIPEVVPFSNQHNTEATVYQQQKDDQVQIVTKTATPITYSDTNTHMHFMLVCKQKDNLDVPHFQFLGTVTPTTKQKLHGIKRYITSDSPDVCQCELFMFRKSNQVSLTSSLYSVLVDILLQSMQQVSNNESSSVFEFDSTKQGFNSLMYNKIVIEKVQTENYLRVTINSDTEENMLLQIQAIIEELSDRAAVVSSVISDSTLDDMYTCAASLVEEARYIVHGKEKQTIEEKRKHLLSLQCKTDLSFANMIGRSPCEDMKLWMSTFRE